MPTLINPLCALDYGGEKVLNFNYGNHGTVDESLVTKADGETMAREPRPAVPATGRRPRWSSSTMLRR